jgi:uncharacterized iron-regulated protein
MPTDLLDLHLKLLVLEHGRTRVVQSLARISEVSEASIQEQLASATRAKVLKSSKVSSTPDQLLAKMELQPAKRERLATLAREYENKRFLGELRLVGKFFREHQVGAVPKTRVRALPKVLSILAALPESQLDELVADCVNESSRSGFSHLAGAIMGQK